MPPRRSVLGTLGVAALFAAARWPLHRVTFALPVSNDDAIPLLMARHVLRGELSTILWNQPYNGTLDAYLLAPGLLLGSAHAVFRAYEALCAIVLVVLAGALAREVAGARAGWTAAALAAVGTPYMSLMAATGPTPNFLVPLLAALPVLAALRALGPGARPLGRGAITLAGLISGIAIWDSALAIPALAGAGAGLALAGFRPRVPRAVFYLAGVAVGAAPLLIARVAGASAASPVTALRPRWLWAAGVADLLRAAAGLFGLQVPLVVDGPERANLPLAMTVALGVALALAVGVGAAARRGWPLAGWALALALAFAFSRRTGGDEIRYLYGLTVPVLALTGAGLARVVVLPWTRSRAARTAAAAVLAAAIVVPWVRGERVLASVWRDPAHASVVWQVPPLDPVLDTLRRAGVRSAYASLQFAARLGLESRESVVASQAWNERIPGDPLRFRDEVDLDPRPAWVLSPQLSRGMPRAARFRELLREMGGSAHEDLPGDFAVFRSFKPPFDESRPVPPSAFTVVTADGVPLPPTVKDRDGHTGWTAPQGIVRGSGLVVAVDPPRALSAIVLQVPLDPTPLGTHWVCEADGTLVASGPMPFAMQWVNGAPRAGRQALLSIPLPGTRAARVRLLFEAAGPPLGVSEVFLYGPDEPAVPAAGAPAAEAAYEAARRGDWDGAVRRYAEAARLEPERASLHAALARAEWRAAGRRHLDVESLDDGGPALVDRR